MYRRDDIMSTLHRKTLRSMLVAGFCLGALSGAAIALLVRAIIAKRRCANRSGRPPRGSTSDGTSTRTSDARNSSPRAPSASSTWASSASSSLSSSDAVPGACAKLAVESFLDDQLEYYIVSNADSRALTSSCEGCNLFGYGCADAVVPIDLNAATYANNAFAIAYAGDGRVMLFNPSTNRYVAMGDRSGRTRDPGCANEACMSAATGTVFELQYCAGSGYALKNVETGGYLHDTTATVAPHNACLDNVQRAPTSSATWSFLALDPVTKHPM